MTVLLGGQDGQESSLESGERDASSAGGSVQQVASATSHEFLPGRDMRTVQKVTGSLDASAYSWSNRIAYGGAGPRAEAVASRGSSRGDPLPAVLPVLPRPASQPDSDLRAIICAPEWSWPCGWALSVVACESNTMRRRRKNSYKQTFRKTKGKTYRITKTKKAIPPPNRAARRASARSR